MTSIGAAAPSVFVDGQEMLERIVEEDWLEARAVVGFWQANSDGDDINVVRSGDAAQDVTKLHTLRQQMKHADDRPNYALADFIAPTESGLNDHIGAFAVTTGSGLKSVVLLTRQPTTTTRRSC